MELLDEYGWLPLIRATYHDENLTNNWYIKKCSLEHWIMYCDEILPTVEPAILKAICRGDVNAAVKGDADLRKMLQKYEERPDGMHAIYLRQMTVGINEEALLIDEARRLASIAMQYANQDSSDTAADEAYAIDRVACEAAWHIRYTISGRRHFIEGSNGDVDPEKKRVLQRFSRTLTRLADQAEKENKTHIPFLQDVGYATKGLKDERKYGNGRSGTSWLFLFTKYILESWKDISTVKMHHFTIALIVDVSLGPVGQMLLSRLARAYYFAGGFTISQAGASMSILELLYRSEVERQEMFQYIRLQLSKDRIDVEQ
ncbi:hypothetical protein J4E80_006285 [Alternaria sp. BMP 0032]|nr:hypothetical protein J4E80_006285 [Alternaria sp. BMP 0032]